MRAPLRDRCRGRWASLLPAVGVQASYLTGKPVPCPVCGTTKKKFRFDDQEGRGTWICTCGAGDGISLIEKVRRVDFRAVVEILEPLVDAAPIASRRKADHSDKDKLAAMNAVWRASKPVQPGDPVGRYLHARIGLTAFPDCLRVHPRLKYQDDPPSWHPAMIAMVTGPDGKPAILHRTYITEDGCKAGVEAPRRLMPGTVPKGAAIRLMPHEGILGIAEGIETAFAAASLFGVPCWAALSARMMAAWEPPHEIHEVIVFGDNDPKFAGQAAAFTLAHRLAVEGRTARVEMPTTAGSDWNDVQQAEIRFRA